MKFVSCCIYIHYVASFSDIAVCVYYFIPSSKEELK